MTKKWTTWWSRAQRGLGVLNQKAPQHHRIVLTSIPSSQSIRFKFAAYYDTQDIMIENVLCHDSYVSRTVTFHGQSSCQLFPGKDILSDEIQMDSNELTLEYEIVTQEGYNCVSGFEYMDYDPFRQAPKQIYALQSIELFSEELKGCVAYFGDSIAEQGHCARLLQQALIRQGISLLNLGLSGNRLLHQLEHVDLRNTPLNKVAENIEISKQCFGISGIERYPKEVLSCQNLKMIIVAVGINDIYQPGTFCAYQEQLPTFSQMQNAYEQLNTDVPMLWCGITPFRLNADWTEAKEKLRLEINAWIKERFQNTIDFDYLFHNEKNVIIEDLLQKDGLHPTKAGGTVMAKEMIKWFKLYL